MKQKMLRKVLVSVLAIAMAASIMPSVKLDAAVKAKLNKSKVTLAAGAKKTIKVTGKNIKKVTWKSSKKSIVTVKKKGAKSAVLTGVAEGKTNVKATVKFKKGKKVLTCKVTVTGAAADSNTPSGNNGTNQGNNGGTNNTPNNQTTDNNPTQAPVVTDPTPEPTPAGPTPIPEQDPDNFAVANYPTVFSDIPDNDFIRVGGNYYMVSTTMNMFPGAPIMKSTDLVHWQIVNYVFDKLGDDNRKNLENGQHCYTNGQWASAIRYDEETGTYYVCFNSNGDGFYVYTTDDVENGEWKKHFTRDSFHDPGLLVEDGNIYVFYGGGPLNCQQLELDDETETVRKVNNPRNGAVLQKTSGWGLWEGCHVYHIGDYYYAMIIASPNSGWFRSETCYRTKDLFEPNWNGQWEEQIIFQGSTYEYGTGIAQGGIVDTIYGDWYGILFQDHDAAGRIPSILEVNWDYTDKSGKNYVDWPMMGYRDENGDFVSCQSTRDKVTRPLTIRLNDSGEENYFVCDDDFDYEEGEKLKLPWQWNHNRDDNNWSVLDNPGYYRITNGKTVNNIWFARNSLTQRTYGPSCVSETCMIPTSMKPGDYAGLVCEGSAYGMVGVRCDNSGNLYIFQGSGSFNNSMTVNASADKIDADTPVYLKIEYRFNTGNVRADKAKFYYSLDGESWKSLGNELGISFSTSTTFMGTRTWLSNFATSQTGGYVDFDYYKIYDL